jgi:hypothetical protein
LIDHAIRKTQEKNILEGVYCTRSSAMKRLLLLFVVYGIRGENGV